MAGEFSMKPLSSHRFDESAAAHLIRRAAFGATPAQISAVAAMGLDKAIDYIVDYGGIDASDLPEAEVDPDVISPPNEEERIALRAARQQGDQASLDRFRQVRLIREGEDRQQMGDVTRWWLGRMISTPRPLEENLTLMWHGHFASRHRNVRDSYLMFKQNQFFREHASGSFADMAHGIIHDPAMLIFLNNNSNNRRKPNENLARELMELFTLGEGNYTEQDIREGARALTGYGVSDNDFEFHRAMHDPGSKTILGDSGTHDGDKFVDILLAREACPRFIAYKLYRHFVADIDGEADPRTQGCINQIATALRRFDYQIAPTLKFIFRSEHFHSEVVVGAKIKSPAELLVGTIRTLNTPVRSLSILGEAMDIMGQTLFDPPSVAGWDGGRGWINTSTLFARQNLCAYLVAGKLPFNDGWTQDEVAYDPMFLIADMAVPAPAKVVDRVLSLLVPAGVTSQRRQELVQFVEQNSERIRPGTLVALLLVVTAMPEYQLC